MLIGFREGARKEEREREININVREKYWSVAVCTTGEQTCNLGVCPDQESNEWPFSSWDDTPTNWATPAMALLNFQFWPQIKVMAWLSPGVIISTVVYWSSPAWLFIARNNLPTPDLLLSWLSPLILWESLTSQETSQGHTCWNLKTCHNRMPRHL